MPAVPVSPQDKAHEDADGEEGESDHIALALVQFRQSWQTMGQRHTEACEATTPSAAAAAAMGP